MNKKIKIESFIERLNNADFKQGTKFKFLDKIYLYDYPNLVGVYEIGKPTKPEYSIFAQLDMTNLHCEVEILEDNTEEQEKLGESWKEVGRRVGEWAKEFEQGFKESFTEIINYPFKSLEDNTEEIEELDNWFVDERKECREFDIQAINLCFCKHRDKINELVKAVNEIRKDLNK